MNEAFVFPIKFIEAAAIGADPENPGMIFDNGSDEIITDTVGVGGIVLIDGELIFLAVKFVESAATGPYPKCTGAIFIDSSHMMMIQTVGFSRGSQVTDKAIFCPIIPVEAAVNGANPQGAAAVFINGIYVIIAQAVGIAGDVPVYLEIVSVIPVKSVFGTEPHKTPGVAANSEYRALGESFFHREMLEAEMTVITVEKGGTA